jgi:effector-binding domain-containing protein
MTITYTIVDSVLPAQDTAVVRGEMAPEQMPTWLGEAYSEVAQYLARAAVTPAGPPFARYTFLADSVGIEAGFPVPFEVAGDERVQPSRLPECAAAVTTHMGPYEDLENAYRAVVEWLDEHGRQQRGPHWEIYLTDPNTEPDPARWRTDIVVPFRSRQDSAGQGSSAENPKTHREGGPASSMGV